MIEYICDFKIIIIIFIFYLIYRIGIRKQNIHLKLGCDGPMPLPFVGNLISYCLEGVHEFDKRCHKKYGSIYPSYFAAIPLAMVSDEELLKQILIKDFKCFTDRLDVGLNSKISEKMLTVLKGKDWERVRNLITPTFTSGKLKKMSPMLEEAVHLLMERIHRCHSDSDIDMKEFFGALTMDAIARTMFGMAIDSQTNPKNPFIVNAKKIFDISIVSPINFLILIFPILGKMLLKVYPDWELLGNEPMSFFKTNIQRAIEERKASTDEYNDFLALMLKVNKDGEGESDSNEENHDTKYLTTIEIAAQSIIFLIAGYETTATTLTFASYFLAKNPEIQKKLYEELKETIGSDGKLSYEKLMQMPLLDGCINETLRLCPPIIRFERVCTQNVDLITSEKRIIRAEKGDVFAVSVYALHTDPSIWPDPEVFDIHRFDADIKKDRNSYAFMPFGMGPRNCVGMRFAILEMKWALANILKEFELLPCDKTPNEIKFKSFGFSQSVKPIIITVKKRE